MIRNIVAIGIVVFGLVTGAPISFRHGSVRISHSSGTSNTGSYSYSGSGNTSSDSSESSGSSGEVMPAITSVPQTGASKSSLLAIRSTKVVKINGDRPYFTSSQLTKKPYIKLSKLDSLGRCGAGMMCAYYTNIASTSRGDISSVHPTGWKQAFVKKNGKKYALYNRSHILMYKLSGINDNKNGLITGTKYFNQTLMLSVESQVLDYVRSSKEHVIYRVTPVFSGSELVARGVLIEAESVESDGLKLCRYVPNIEPGISINYATGAASSALPSVSVS